MLIALSGVHASKWNVNSLFNEKPALDVIALLLMWEVGTWAWILNICLFRVRSINFVSPEVYSMCGATELIISTLGTVLAKCGIFGC